MTPVKTIQTTVIYITVKRDNMTIVERKRPDKYGDTGTKGSCICHQCGTKVESNSNPCNERICLKCGARMGRDSDWLIPFDRRMPY